MRVIAGTLGGRSLLAPRGAKVRPTADRVREATFSSLGPVDGLAVLDLWAGTGALAIEALSRGAATATLVDRDPAPARANLTALALAERAAVHAARLPGWLGEARGPYDLVFCDPPYTIARLVSADLDRLLPPLLAPGARVVLESARREPAELALPLLRRRDYGETTVAIHAAAEAAR